ncbi:MAG: alpha-amylase family protein, partial [Bacteroidales bacterium]|nr:alpha-amylase family protein [Bacteroidales bacterium]
MLPKFAIYQVLPRLFGNRVSQPKLNGSIKENGCGKLNDFTPAALQSIKDLGITHIWYTGIIRHATTTRYKGIPKNNEAIVKGKAGSPYAITDYYDVHPDLAENAATRMQEFEELVQRTHDLGLKVIIDFVPNHVSREYQSSTKPKPVMDFGANDDTTKAFHSQNNFYYFPDDELHLPFENHYKEKPAKVSGNDVFSAYPSTNDWYETIKLNYGKDYSNNQNYFDPIPNTWFKMLDILQFWSNKGIDGFRCDMAEMVPVEFWAWVIPQVKALKANMLFIAEIYNTHAYQSYIEIGRFDYLYDKVGLYDTLRNLIDGKQTAQSITSLWQSQNGLENHLLRFLENHDEQRIASAFFASNPWKAIPAFFLLASMHSTPFLIYSGQEFGEKAENESGFSGKDGRTTLFDYWFIPSVQEWLKNKFDIKKLDSNSQQLYQEYQKIIKFSLDSETISEGQFYDLMWANRDNSTINSDVIFAFVRTNSPNHMLNVCNFSAANQNLRVILP